MAPAEAYVDAVRTLRRMPADSIATRIESMWATLCRSSLTADLPWPLRSIEPVFRRRLHRTSPLDLDNYFLSGF
jgi:hypothetical protein